MRAWSLLGQHRFAEALTLATALNTKVPDDLMVYGMLTDANIELGKYDDAEKSAQWMLDLRPGNIPALTRAAYLRELFGDIDGAIELMQSAFNRMPYQETEDRAWVLTQIGHLELVRGQPAAAEQVLAAGARRSSPTTTTHSASWPTCAPRRSGSTRGRRPAAAALRRGAASREPVRAGRGAGARRA